MNQDQRNPQQAEAIPPINTMPLQINTQKSSHFTKNILIIFISLFILVGVGAGSYLLGIKHSSKNQSFSSSKIIATPTSTLIVSVSPTSIQQIPLNTYTNKELGITIQYLATVSAAAECNAPDSQQQLKEFDDVANNTVYFSPEKTTVINNNNSSSCTAVPVTMDILKNGVPGAKSGVVESLLTSIAYTFKHVTSDADLQSLAQQVFGKECSTVTKAPTATDPSIFDVTVLDAQGNTGRQSSCVTDYVYDFVYSPKNQSAVARVIGQNCPFSTVPGGITKDGCGAKVTFTK